MIKTPVSEKPNLLRITTLILSALALLIMDGCGSTTLFNMWKDPTYQHPPLSNILVIGVREDPLRRKIWENGFTEELQKYGVTAIPSYRLFPNALPDTLQIAEAVQANGFDGILVSHWLSSKPNLEIVPGYTTTERVTRLDPLNNHYDTFYRELQHPPTVDTINISLHEIDVWCTQNPDKIVWTGKTKTANPSTIRENQQEVVTAVVDELADMGIIPPLQ